VAIVETKIAPSSYHRVLQICLIWLNTSGLIIYLLELSAFPVLENGFPGWNTTQILLGKNPHGRVVVFRKRSTKRG